MRSVNYGTDIGDFSLKFFSQSLHAPSRKRVLPKLYLLKHGGTLNGTIGIIFLHIENFVHLDRAAVLNLGV